MCISSSSNRIYAHTPDGELQARVIQTKTENTFEMMREIIHKGKNRNPNRLLELKAKALAPTRAKNVNELEKVLTEWKFVRRTIVEEDPEFSMADETLQTLLLRIIPADYVKDMREYLNRGLYKNDYYGFAQAL